MWKLLAVVIALLSGCGYFAFDPVANRGDASPDLGTDAGTDAELGGDAGPGSPTLSRLCSFASLTVVLDGDATDTSVGGQLAGAIASGCGTTPSVRMLDQATPGLLDPSTHGPLLGPDDLGVVGGDDYYQLVMTYMEMGRTPLVSDLTATDWTIVERASGVVVATRPLSALGPSHDLSVIEVSEDPSSGTLVLSAYGLYFGGTLAAGFHFVNVLAPTLASDPKRWYVLEWTNVDGDPSPTSGDTFTVVASGS